MACVVKFGTIGYGETYQIQLIGYSRKRSRADSSVGLVYAGLVVLVLGVEARLEVVDERGRRRH